MVLVSHHIMFPQNHSLCFLNVFIFKPTSYQQLLKCVLITLHHFLNVSPNFPPELFFFLLVSFHRSFAAFVAQSPVWVTDIIIII